MPLKTIKIFIASSAELKADREDFRTFISNQNDRLSQQGIYLHVVQWENFIDAISDTRLQDEYNKAMRECDIALCLFFTKVGKYTAEEFDTAYQVFKETGKPKIWTYFKNAAVDTGSITEDINTLFAFKKKIGEMGHFYTGYTNIDNLINQFRNQLDKVLPQMVSRGEGMPDAGNNNAADTKPPVRNAFNEILTRRLIESIKKYNPPAKTFSDNATRMAADWETQERFSDPAKKIIASAFVGVLGIQLRKLTAIGKEDYSENKLRRYLENCSLAVKRALQVLCFSLLSKLWDYKKDMEVSLLPEQSDALTIFFNEFEQDISGLIHLFKNLYQIFADNSLEYPLAELKDFAGNLQAESPFLNACVQLQSLPSLLSNFYRKISLADCVEAEIALATVLETVSFLVNYKMMSIKSIGYFEMRNRKPHYLYNYTALGIDGKSDVANREGVNYAEAPIITDAVLLYKGNYRQNLNLFPFIVDINALTSEGGAKICFYSGYDNAHCTVKYSFLEDNSVVEVCSNPDCNISEQLTDINKLLAADPKKYKDIRLENVYSLVKEAKITITGIEEEVMSDNPFA